MQEEDVRDHGGLDAFCRTGANAVQDTGAHEAAVRRGLGAPDGRAEADDLGEDVDWSATERGAQWDPGTSR